LRCPPSSLSDEASFEFSDHPENRHQDGTGDIRRRELRLKNAQNRASLSEVMNEVQNVAGVTAQPIQLEDDKLVTLSDELHDGGEFVSPFPGPARDLFTSNDRASGLAEAVLLDRQVLAL